MKLSPVQEKAIAHAERLLRRQKFVAAECFAFGLLISAIVFYDGWGSQSTRNALIFCSIAAFCWLMRTYVRSQAALAQLLAAYQDSINADPQALAQQYTAKLGGGDPESLTP
jgi:hypothetical protein